MKLGCPTTEEEFLLLVKSCNYKSKLQAVTVYNPWADTASKKTPNKKNPPFLSLHLNPFNLVSFLPLFAVRFL